MSKKTTIKEKIRNLEAEIAYLKMAVIDRPDFSVDEENWKKIKPVLKKIRTRIFKKLYA